MDDTLIRSHINYHQIRQEIAELFDSPIPENTITKTPILKLLEKLKEVHPNKYSEGYRRVYETEREATKRADIIEGAQAIPRLLKKYKIHSAIYTNNSLNTVRQYLAKPKFDFLHEFQILTREDFKNPKPDPEGLLKIIEIHQSTEINRKNTAYVGDSYIDAIAAHRAKVKFIWFNSREVNPDLFPTQPYAILSNWADFESIILQK